MTGATHGAAVVVVVVVAGTTVTLMVCVFWLPQGSVTTKVYVAVPTDAGVAVVLIAAGLAIVPLSVDHK